MRDERRKEGRSKQGQTNNKAKQHSTPNAVAFPKKNELPLVGLEPTTLYTRSSCTCTCIYTCKSMVLHVHVVVVTNSSSTSSNWNNKFFLSLHPQREERGYWENSCRTRVEGGGASSEEARPRPLWQQLHHPWHWVHGSPRSVSAVLHPRQTQQQPSLAGDQGRHVLWLGGLLHLSVFLKLMCGAHVFPCTCTWLPWVCCVALPCLFDLACFFRPSFSSLIKTCTCNGCVCVCVCVCVGVCVWVCVCVCVYEVVFLCL